MKFHNINMVGPFNNEHQQTLPPFDEPKDRGRQIWLEDGSLWYGEIDRWVKLLAAGNNFEHNDMNGRSEHDCHPISAITGLEDKIIESIQEDTTIYLAPSASNQSPDGVAVGNDDTGDGTEAAPFFSIKKAMEYIEGFNIKIGVFVTIRGLPGHYHYNENHVVEIKHKDAKYIKIMFDMMDAGNYHETFIVNNPITVTNEADGDHITFSVDNVGSDFYQIHPGDYIKIYCGDPNLAQTRAMALWCGYFKVHYVDIPGKKVTIIYKKYDDPAVRYTLPDTPQFSNKLQIIKLSTHIFVDVQDVSALKKGYFLYSEYGFGGFQLNASNEVYNNTGIYDCSFFYIYDGVINDIMFHLNGFYKGTYFENLGCNFDHSHENKIFVTITNCQTGITFDNSNVVLIRHCITNTFRCIFTINSKVILSSTYTSMCINGGIGYWVGSSTLTSTNVTNIYTIVCYDMYEAFFGNKGDIYISCFRIDNCFYGLTCRTSSLRTFADAGTDLSQGRKPVISNCDKGIFAFKSSSLIIKYVDIISCEKGIYILNSSITINSNNNLNPTYISNSAIGLYCNNSDFKTDNLKIRQCTVAGVYCLSSTGATTFSTFHDSNNTGYGLYASQSRVFIENTIIREFNYGVFCNNQSKITINSTIDNSRRVYNNASYDLVATHDSSIFDLEISTANKNSIITNPAKNPPSITYSGYNGGTYIIVND